MAMKKTAENLPGWTAHAPVYDLHVMPDATLTDRARRASSIDTAERAVVALPQLSVANEAEADLVLEGLLGRGGMGIVHVARQRALDREVAIKRIRPEAVMRANAISLLLAEARIQGALDHPNVVPIHALGRDTDDLPVLVMKRLSGVSWRTLIRDPAHPAWPKEAGDRLAFHIETLMQVCNAVHFAHSRGVIHRDIKPENVMIGAFGEVYLLDWGVAYRPHPDDAPDPTIVGTPAYLAPEMLKGTGPHVTPRSDVYLLGATLHEILMREVRHRGDTILEVLYAAAESLPFDYPPSVPAELAALCTRATSRDPAARPESARAFRQAIADFLQHRGSNALAEAAAARLTDLRARGGAALLESDAAGGADPAIRALFSEASFGFRQALLLWEGNPIARAGLTETLTWMIGYELSRRHAEAAAALLAELPEPSPGLAAEIEALRVELARERDELARLRDAARDLDLVISFRPRILLIMSLGLFVCALMLAMWMWSPSPPSHVDLSLVFGAGILCLLVTLIVRRKHLLANQANRQIASMLLLFLLMGLGNHLVARALDLSVAIAIVWDMVVSAAIGAMAAITIHKSFWTAPPSFALGAVIAGYWPHLALPGASLASLSVLTLGGLIGWRLLRAVERSAPR
jgi:tRNA A-37 threonylcarbamoyl transferase component Bud32